MSAATRVPHYLSKTEVAARLGMKSASSLGGVKLPPHDVEVGTHKGWLPDTIDAWHVTRQGRGWHGGR